MHAPPLALDDTTLALALGLPPPDEELEVVVVGGPPSVTAAWQATPRTASATDNRKVTATRLAE